MRASTAYFVGAGTIIAAIAIGLGGGIVAGNIMHPVASRQGPDTSKMAQRTEGATPATTNAPSERVNYLTGSQAFGAMMAAPARAEAKPEAAKSDTQTTQANAEPPAPQPSQAAAVEPPRPAPAVSAQAARPAEPQASTEPSSASNNAYAKARESDVKRAATERRRAERRERWAERRHHELREPRGMRDRTDWDDVARNVREDSEARDYAGRPRSGFPQIRLFGPDDE
ncbi:hypothetical protein [Bradyrhizobium sp. CCBAU 51765]|uniref:hypothetical protein n=1 Tax=Bradyrhizobium sp. CCBAU 51765 TaxID=1325102 RepID=UPI00188972FE|nr:hypothetical protein [Bradyrhizobium sp. CCBAU 51765]QOZ12446.1 hypothetical protein XH96_37255 [Bradyrhizobium sp. CCBAU 51765]